MITSKNIVQMLNETGFCISGFDGESMLPALHSETDKLFIVPVSSLEVGDVIVFRHKSQYCAHRIVRKSLFGWKTKGDNNAACDRTVRSKDVIGLAAGYIRNGDFYSLNKVEFNIEVAGCRVRVKCGSFYKRYFKLYLCGDQKNENIDYYIGFDEKKDFQPVLGCTDLISMEWFDLFSELTVKIIDSGVLIGHAAAVEYGGEAYVFMAPSGTGKTTHIKNWHKLLGDEVKILNGDKPAFKFEDGRAMAIGTPWCGKEGLQRNVSVPLRAICFLNRTDETHGPSIEKIENKDALEELLMHLYKNKDAKWYLRMLSLVGDIFSGADFYRLYCDNDEASAKISFEAMTGKSANEVELTEK